MSRQLQTEQPEPQVDRSLVRQLLQPCIEKLTARERNVLYLLQPWLAGEDDPEERTLEEVAGLLAQAQGHEVTRNAAAQAAFVMRQKLKRCLEGRGFHTANDVLERASAL